LEPEACETSGMKGEPYEDEDTDHCFVYDMAKNQGGIPRWLLHRIVILVKITYL
jgi:hypothetical protein